jgi:hypothetical protein
MNKNDLKKLIGECIKEMSNDGDEFKVFNTDVDRSMARQKDLAFGTGEIKFKSNTGTDYTVSIDNGDIIDVVDKRGNTYNVDEIQTYWEKGFTLIGSISATIGDAGSSQPDEEEKPMLYPPEELQETDKEVGLDDAEKYYGVKKSNLVEKAPPGFPKKFQAKLLNQYKDSPAKAYAMMWKLHNKHGNKLESVVSEVKNKIVKPISVKS